MSEMSLLQIFLIALACFGLWAGSKMVTESVLKLARLWGVPVFTLSFIILGVLTSLPELTVLSSSLVAQRPEIAAGNLFGGMMMLFFFILPLLAIVKNGVALPKEFSREQLLFLLIVVMSPTLLSADKRLDKWEGALFILLYGVLSIFLLRKPNLFQRLQQKLAKKHVQSTRLFLLILAGVIILVGAGHVVVRATTALSDLYHVPAFFVSLFLLSFGTNLPEMSLIFRAIGQRKNDIAFADYLGSASFNTFLFGILALFSQAGSIFPNHFLYRIFLLTSGCVLFFLFSQSKREISRKEGILLLTFGFLFLLVEAWLVSRMTI